MTTEEMSNTIDTLLNSYNIQANFGNATSKQEIVLDEYEKSMLLTQAQDLVVKSYFDKTLNPQGQGFDDAERRQVDFSSLIKVSYPVKAEISGNDLDTTTTDDLTIDSNGKVTIAKDPTTGEAQYTELDSYIKYDDRSIVYKLPKEVLFILNETIRVDKYKGDTHEWSKQLVIKPISYREYDREMSKAYAQPLKKQAWRLFNNPSTGYDIFSEIILNEAYKDKPQDNEHYNVAYKLRFIKRPQPIVLVELPNDLTIDGVREVTQCELNPILHMDIVNKAVELAIVTKSSRMAPQSDMRPQQQQQS